MFNWSDFLTLAEELSERQDEPSKRSAISRAYYSAFCNAREYLAQKEFKYTSKDRAHETVWKTFDRLGPQGKKISIQGDRLKRMRVRADYENQCKNLNTLTKQALLEANSICNSINTLK
ncbi:hypothetical protein P5750_08695 [Bacillus cereus]|uniref:hypothetical protein n=1 Tax=Bacillus cereus TaxID=1396 RepID=UPI002405CEB9|nr:hypothetical protein [Bacillus cereus]MDF9540338.1 hypothetical protein [Bacillus cereus]MDF9583461.1 hypothetical protein [Bacillus cereus]MDF9583529.1 hypothetical protein [Bacillus cereus]MDG1590346.1 hypothetical protein [Bacillus cereus]